MVFCSLILFVGVTNMPLEAHHEVYFGHNIQGVNKLRCWH